MIRLLIRLWSPPTTEPVALPEGFNPVRPPKSIAIAAQVHPFARTCSGGMRALRTESRVSSEPAIRCQGRHTLVVAYLGIELIATPLSASAALRAAPWARARPRERDIDARFLGGCLSVAAIHPIGVAPILLPRTIFDPFVEMNVL